MYSYPPTLHPIPHCSALFDFFSLTWTFSLLDVLHTSSTVALPRTSHTLAVLLTHSYSLTLYSLPPITLLSHSRSLTLSLSHSTFFHILKSAPCLPPNSINNP